MFLFYVWENRLRKLSNLPEWLNRDQVSLTSAAFMDDSVIWMKKVLSEAQASWGYSNKVPPLRGLNNRNSLSQFWRLEVWDQSLRSRCLLGWFPLKAVRQNLFCVLSLGFWVPQAFLGLQMAFFLCLHIVFSLRVSCLFVQRSAFYEDTNRMGLGTTLITWF